MRTNIEEVFKLNDEHKIFEFCKDYALNNPYFAEMLIERFLPKKNINGKTQFIEINNELEQCFKHSYDGKQDKYRSTELDWNVIYEYLGRLILRGKYLLTNGLINETIHLALGVLRRVGEEYGTDCVYEDYEFDGLDFSTKDAVSLLEEAMKHQCITKKDMLNIADELEKIGELEAYNSYGLCDFGDLFERIKKSQLSEEEYLKHLKSDMDKADDYYKEGCGYVHDKKRKPSL